MKFFSVCRLFNVLRLWLLLFGRLLEFELSSRFFVWVVCVDNSIIILAVFGLAFAVLGLLFARSLACAVLWVFGGLLVRWMVLNREVFFGGLR